MARRAQRAARPMNQAFAARLLVDELARGRRARRLHLARARARRRCAGRGRAHAAACALDAHRRARRGLLRARPGAARGGRWRWSAPRARRRRTSCRRSSRRRSRACRCVVLTADRPPELRDCGAPQTIDQVRLFGSHVRWTSTRRRRSAGARRSTRYARTLARRAVATALRPPAGPGAPQPAVARAAVDAARAETPPALGARSRRRRRGRRGHAAARRADRARRSRGACAARASWPRRAARRDRLRPADADAALPAAIAALARAPRLAVLAEPLSQLRFGAARSRRAWSTPTTLLLRDAAFARRAWRPTPCCGSARCRRRKPLRRWLAAAPGARHVVVDAGGALARSDAARRRDVRARRGRRALCDALAAALLGRGAPRGTRRGCERWLAARARRARAALDEPCSRRRRAASRARRRELADALPDGAHALRRQQHAGARRSTRFWPRGRAPRCACSATAAPTASTASSRRALGAAAARPGRRSCC